MKNLPKTFGAMFIMAVILCLGLATQAATLTIIPSFGPQSSDPAFQTYANQAATTIWSTGTLPTGPRSGVTDARMATNMIADDFMTTPLNGTPQYRGTFNPASPWNSSYGTTLYLWILGEAGQGEMTALSMVTNVISSGDPNNLLGNTVTFNPATSSYSPTAPGMAADGSMVNSGQSASTPVKRFVVGIGTKSFPVSNAGDVANVRNYFAPYIYWNVTANVTLGVTGGTSTVVTNMFAIQKPLPPKMTTSVTGNQFSVMAESNGDINFYTVQSSTNILGPWSTVGSLQAGQTLNLSTTTGDRLFIRYRPSP